jgi:N-acetylglutamate synthase-like GNAT family acetyltransferase
MSVIRRYTPNDHHNLLSFLGEAMTDMGYAFLPDQKDSDIRDIHSVYLLNRGTFYVIDNQGAIRGSAGVRRFSDDVAELKRLYVGRDCRGNGMGERLCNAAMDDARALGYRLLRLDTTRKSVEAIGLFRKLGFVEIERYNQDPFADLFFEKVL